MPSGRRWRPCSRPRRPGRPADVGIGVGGGRQPTHDVGDRSHRVSSCAANRRRLLARLAGLSALIPHERLHPEPDDSGDGRPHRSPGATRRAVAGGIADEERQHEHCHARRDPARDLLAPEIRPRSRRWAATRAWRTRRRPVARLARRAMTTSRRAVADVRRTRNARPGCADADDLRRRPSTRPLSRRATTPRLRRQRCSQGSAEPDGREGEKRRWTLLERSCRGLHQTQIGFPRAVLSGRAWYARVMRDDAKASPGLPVAAARPR